MTKLLFFVALRNILFEMRIPNKANVLLLGGGGRECAFAAAIARSSKLNKLYIAPGNAGTAMYGENVDISPVDFPIIGQFVISNNINLVVVGPEDPLVKGIVDFFADNDNLKLIPVIGPSKKAAQLEGSKEFAKEFMMRHGIPTAAYLTVTEQNMEEGREFLRTHQAPYVLKADGLAAGKGVLILDNLQEALSELDNMILSKKFGQASSKVVLEEFLSGIELSVFVATDGVNYKILAPAKDYKRIYDADKGPNTGGMGSVSPVPFADEEFMAKIEEQIVKPTVAGIAEEKLGYKGFIFLGLMNCNGEPKVIEYNVRMGDPETQSVLTRLDSDILDLFGGIISKIDKVKLAFSNKTALTVVVAAGGYPGKYSKGNVISGLSDVDGVSVYHSGTTNDGEHVLTSGGRVLAVTALAENIGKAREKVYSEIEKIGFDGMQYRKDIGMDII